MCGNQRRRNDFPQPQRHRPSAEPDDFDYAPFNQRGGLDNLSAEALGKGETPSTFDEQQGNLLELNSKTAAQKKRGEFYGFSRTEYGIVKTRTNGKRLFVYTDSGNVKMKEAYAYALDSSGVPKPSKVLRA